MIVRFAARDPGGANVLAAFLNGSRLRQSFTPDVWTMPKAAGVFDRAGIPARVFADPIASRELEREWSRLPAGLLITGTSHQTPFESALWEIGRRHGCPSLAMLDQWCNLGLRFQSARPDYVGAIDTGQVRDLVEMGFPVESVIVVGHPWLTDLIARRGAQTGAPRTEHDRGSVCILFVSENIADDVASGRNAPFGFDEIDSFDVLYRGVCAAADRGAKVSLAVKCHPYEDPERFRRHVQGLAPPPSVRIVCLPHDAEPRAWVLWSDLVVGISSMLLFEAMVLERPVVSLQPGLIRENTFEAGVNGYARTLTEPAEAVSFMARLIADPAERMATLHAHRRFTGTLQQDSLEPVLGWIRASVSA